jgi:16S rRNA (cytosine967-C5)-methyltransferase
MSGARQLASLILRRVWDDGAYAAAALSAELDRHPELDPRDKGLVTELTYGVLRTEKSLFDRLSRYGALKANDSALLSHLFIAAYQLSFLDRIPAHAAVSVAVESVRELRGPKVAGFANALLRKIAEEGKKELPKAVVASAPRWLFDKIARDVGHEEATLLFGGAGSVTSTALRARAGRPLRDWMNEPGRVEKSPVTPGALRYHGGGDPRRLDGFTEGDFVVQEEGAQLLAWAVGARPGESVLDACAGRGQKASLLAEHVGESGTLVAADLHANKLSQLAEEFRRLGLREPERLAIDWAAPNAGAAIRDRFDRVLVDAPCTGDGTLRRRPEIAHRLKKDDPARLAELQERILRAAAQCAKPGGTVVYATCSVLREECEAIVERVSDLLEPAPFDAPAVGAVFAPTESALRLLPGRHGTDGYFVAALRRR